MPKKATPFLMFEGRAEEAMTFYAETFNGAAIKKMTRYGPDGPGEEGTVLRGVMTIAGQEVIAFDSHVPHGFTFTPSVSFFIECDSEEELDCVYAALNDGGATMMAPGNYGFSKKFAWVADRFGVSWQLNLA